VIFGFLYFSVIVILRLSIEIQTNNRNQGNTQSIEPPQESMQ
jgi:hypothetical protein